MEQRRRGLPTLLLKASAQGPGSGLRFIKLLSPRACVRAQLGSLGSGGFGPGLANHKFGHSGG